MLHDLAGYSHHMRQTGHLHIHAGNLLRRVVQRNLVGVEDQSALLLSRFADRAGTRDETAAVDSHKALVAEDKDSRAQTGRVGL